MPVSDAVYLMIDGSSKLRDGVMQFAATDISKRRLPARKLVGGTDSGENAVRKADRGR
jgi:hypothetical protein